MSKSFMRLFLYWNSLEPLYCGTRRRMASMEEDFPRGGTEKKTTESKNVKAHDVDNLFEVR